MAVVVGRIRAIVRYPVKSMAGEELPHADVTWYGLAGDRRWAFVRPNRPLDGFPWLTIRQRPDLMSFHPRLGDPTEPDRSAGVVHWPDGRITDVIDLELENELGATAMKLDRGTFDALPLSIISTGTVDELAASSATVPDYRRMRPNLLVTGPASIEQCWIGCELEIGEARLRVDRGIKRCMVVNYDPGGGARTPQVLRHIAQTQNMIAGVYASTVRPGRVHRDNEVVLAEPVRRRSSIPHSA